MYILFSLFKLPLKCNTKQVSTYKDFDVRGGLEFLAVNVLSCFVILGALFRDEHFFYKPVVATFASWLKF